MANFTPGELDVMRILWDNGPLKPGEIQERFPRPIKDPALRSYLTILVEKGHVSRRRTGKAFVYRALTPRERAFRAMVGRIVDAFCEGSARKLLAHLVREEKLSPQDLRDLERIAEGGEAAGNPGKGGHR